MLPIASFLIYPVVSYYIIHNFDFIDNILPLLYQKKDLFFLASDFGIHLLVRSKVSAIAEAFQLSLSGSEVGSQLLCVSHTDITPEYASSLKVIYTIYLPSEKLILFVLCRKYASS